MRSLVNLVLRFRFGGIVFAAAALAIAISTAGQAETTAPIDWDKLNSEALGYFRDFAKFDTTNPPSNTAVAIDYLKKLLDHEGIATETFESKPGMVSLVAKIPGPAGVKPMLLMSHADVVPAVGANWTHPPFGADLSDGYVWARGAIDDKAHGIMALMTMIALKRGNVPLRRGIELMVNPDEEAGGANGAEWMVKTHWDAIDPAFAFNEGGGGAPDWLGLRGTSFQIAVSEKRVMWLHLTLRGKGGHGSVPKPDNPNLVLVNALHRLLENQPPIRITPIIAQAMDTIAPLEPFPASFELSHLELSEMNKLAIAGVLSPYNIQALLRDTISLTMLNAGVKVNVVPTVAEASLDCRLLPGTDADAFLKRMRDLLGDERFTIDYLQHPDEAPPSPSSGEAWDAIKRAVEKNFKGALVVPWMTTGGTDSRFLRERGVPSYGFVPTILASGEIARVHGDDERLSVENLNRGIRTTYDLAIDLCAAKD
ncbi:MAG: M20/M25/M40 family metallo-hydrolase [Candidatus Binatus sp.]|uniref:M20/M25/M40 family metallo-hydrolase n=1 Tax=Candidatus Binatus sp. TaxID=2811406 RepID=UPI00272516EC|nr:M20/M25/M40 family metallo-hydrolase [Candidatus Binatus sp.]MDO8433992.1 M20/M25/M40 family metallo-hydrolase [Candidatus Binatus sp.]